MEIKFKLIDEQFIKIIGIQNEVEKEIGCIFTPSSSGNNILNAIQVCGVEEAFDFWGCSRYIKSEGVKKRIINSFEDKRDSYIQMKDIQLLFNFNSEPSTNDTGWDSSKHCWACFNLPCTCENKGGSTSSNPYNLKRENNIKDKLRYNKDENIN